MLETLTDAIARKEELLTAIEEKYSRYCKGDFSDFAAAHEINVAIINVGWYLPNDWTKARPSLSEYMRLMNILLAFIQQEPKSSLIYQKVDQGPWKPNCCYYPTHPLQEDRVLGYWFRKLLQKIIQMETQDEVLSPAGKAAVGIFFFRTTLISTGFLKCSSQKHFNKNTAGAVSPIKSANLSDGETRS